MSTILVRSAKPDDAAEWLRMRVALWPEGTAREHAAEIDQFFAGMLTNPLEVLLAVNEAGTMIGFAELSIRNYAEDCETDRVAYLEGWYVDAAWRRRGVGRALVVAAEAWARAQGCTEFGSDALLENETSAAAHRALGFEETVADSLLQKTAGVDSRLPDGDCRRRLPTPDSESHPHRSPVLHRRLLPSSLRTAIERDWSW